MKLSNAGIDLIKEFEGFSSKPYLCSAGVPTIGYGSTFYENGKKVKITDPKITESRAVELILFQLKNYEKAVNTSIKVELKQNEYDALVSICYNIGVTAFKKSKLVKNINTGFKENKTAISANFLSWSFSKGKRITGLMNRRIKEFNLFIK